VNEKCAGFAVVRGLSPAETVRVAEALLTSGVGTAIDVSENPVLARAMGRDYIHLSPTGPSNTCLVLLRLRDLVAASVALVVLAPLLALLALLVKRSSHGPVLYAARVVGRNGREFTWWKLRTMRVGKPADDAVRRERYRATLANQQRLPADQHASNKIVDESRLTHIGRVLRRHSLDELPQLWNVLRGEMTLVGPRPCLPYEYALQAPWHHLRYRVTPGLTGPWQAYGRSRVTLDEMALIDYCYSRTKSFWLDTRVILRTFVVVVTGEGGG
jgi:lipopolysaccharide/colanic/teichoic acid biosynthesis glycosyltransferase